jgi:hypothetical protein
MSNFEITIGIIGAIVLGVPLVLSVLFLISGYVKKWFDESIGNDSGIFGWIIAIIIGLVILYAIANSNNIIEFDPRHS